MDKLEITQALQASTREDLVKELGQPSQAPRPTAKGEYTIDGLAPGKYYFREVPQETKEKNFYMAPFVLEVPGPATSGDPLYIKPTDDNPNEPGTKVDLVKKSTSGAVLEGAEFRLYERVDGKLVPVPLLEDGTYSKDGDPNRVLVTGKDGKITVKGLPPGDYVFVEVKAPKGYEIITGETDFEVKADSKLTLTVYNKPLSPPEETEPPDETEPPKPPETTEPPPKPPIEPPTKPEEPKKGDHFFYKYAKNDKGKQVSLEGATFKVTRLVDGSYENVLKDDGTIYIVSSGSDGRFKIENLPYGTYYLWETKAPASYAQLKEPIKFEINDQSKDQVISIENKKKPPIDIPETGDLVTGLLILASIGLVGSGLWLLRTKDE